MSVQSPPQNASGPGFFGAMTRWFVFSPVLWGGLLTVGFYYLIPVLPVYRPLAERYFCGHPLEYATAALFFVGIAILAFKALKLRGENRAFDAHILDHPDVRSAADATYRVSLIEKQLDAVSKRHGGTELVVRIRDVCAYVRGRHSSESLEEHLKYLAELASQRLHESYALLRNITWAVPILGFLGTVIGITLAIANVRPEQLDTSLGAVTGGLAVAFDTTALALTLTLVLVFCWFVVERGEQKILTSVEEFGIKRLMSMFPMVPSVASPLAEAESRAAARLIEQTEALVTRQTALWQDALESLRDRWVSTLERQETALCDSLAGGMQVTLEEHAGQMSAMRREFLGAYREVSDSLAANLREAQAAQQSLIQSTSDQLALCWQNVRGDIEDLSARQRAEQQRMHESFSETIRGWQVQLSESSQIALSQLSELRQQGEILADIVHREQDLARLQQRLADNLDALRATETFEDTLHSLSAAVHLLTLRNQPKAA